MSRRLTMIIAACLPLALCACETTSHQDAKQQAQEHWGRVRAGVKLQLATQQFAGGAFEAAVATCSEVITLDPRRVEGYLVLARAYLELGLVREAEEAIESASQLELESPALTYTKATLLERRELWPEALACYRAAREADPKQVDYLVAEAECLVTLKRVDEAVALAESGRERFASDPSLSMLSGHLAALQGDPRGAVKWYGKAAASMPGSPAAAEAYGLALLEVRRYAEAESALRPLILGAGGAVASGAVHRGLATSALQLGRADEARRLMLAHTERQPADAEAQILLAKASLVVDDDMTALRSLHLAQQSVPDSAELWLVRATLQFKRREFAAAEASVRHVLARRPEDVDALCLLGEAEAAQGRSESAARQFARALELDPQCAWAAREVAADRERG